MSTINSKNQNDSASLSENDSVIISIEELPGAMLAELSLQSDAMLLMSQCALSALHLLEGDVGAAGRYADLAQASDTEDAAALVGRGNVLAAGGAWAEALELYDRVRVTLNSS